MKKLYYTFITLLLISCHSLAQDFQYYIFEKSYNYYDSIRPSAYAEMHTYLPGPILEKAVNKNLKLVAKKCAPNAKSKYIFSLEPNLFYNYQMNTLYGELKVKIYSPKNILKDTLTVNTKSQVNIYEKANFHISRMFDSLIVKLNADVLNKLPRDNKTINGDFCTIIELSKPKSIIDEDYKATIQA
tara:strand:- start:1390 stop:1947 length:558 start_codon:yes stop_codon:yes gene_type:complete